MSPKTKLFLKIGVSLGILVVLFSRLDWQEAEELVRNANPLWLLVPVVISVIDRVWMAWKWWLLLAVLSTPPKLMDAIRVYYISSFQGTVLPFGGLGSDILRYVHLRSSGIEPHTVSLSIVVERVIGLVATMAAGVVGILALLSKLDPASPLRPLFLWLLAGAIAACIAGVLVFFHRPTQRFLYRLSRLDRLGERFSNRPIVQKMVEAVGSYQRAPRAVATNLVLSIVEQFIPVLSLYTAAIALQVPVTLLDCVAVTPVTMIVKRLPIGYAGLGLREGAMVFVLGLLGVGYSDTLVLSTTLFLTFLASQLPGAFWGSISRRRADRGGAEGVFPQSPRRETEPETVPKS